MEVENESYKMKSWSFSNSWAFVQLMMMMYHRRNHIKFYSWFHQADNLADSSIRGLSTRGYPVFGVLQVPKLSQFYFNSSLYIYYFTLLFLIFDHDNSFLWSMSSYGSHVRTFMTILSFLLWVCISGSLWAEESLSYHREVLATIVHIYLMLWPSSLSPAKFGFHKLLQCHIASIYFAGANQKIFCSIFQKNPSGYWPLYSPSSFVWRASWTHYTQFLSLKRLLLRHPWVLGLPSGLAALTVEWTLFPYIIFFASSTYDPQERLLPIYFSLLASFHLGIRILQGIDYFSFWFPALTIFLYQDGHLNWSLISPLASNLTTGEGVSVALIYMFLASQLLFSLGCAECFNINLPPLMSCPMFVTINTMFGPYWNNLTIFINKDDVSFGEGIDYPQLEWQYPCIQSTSGVGLDISSVKYFTQNHQILNNDFIIAGIYDEKQPMKWTLDIFGINQKYLVSAKEVENNSSFCKFSRTSYWDGKIFYFITNREKYMSDDIFGKLENFLKFTNKSEISDQLYNGEAVEKCFNFQDRIFQLLTNIE